MGILTINQDNMIRELDSFGLGYSYPVYAGINNMSSFFSSYRRVKYGYAAIVGKEALILTEAGIIGAAEHHILPRMGINKLTVRRSALLHNYVIKIEGISEGRKYRFRLMIAPKVYGSNLPDQTENSAALAETLDRWIREM